MRTALYQLDAFAGSLFRGNPAAVMPMGRFPDDATLQSLAAENNLAETAFLVPQGSDYRLRWFTPTTEVALCGHATLASATVVMERLEPDRKSVTFHSASGPLAVVRESTAYVMDFPVRTSAPVDTPAELVAALGLTPLEVFADAGNYLVRLESPRAVRALTPDFAALARLDRWGVIVTATGKGHGDGGSRDDDCYDFVSRYFAPAKGIPEDPVTGSAHCALAHYWAPRLDKTDFLAHQASKRGGDVTCRLRGDRVQLEGRCVFYLEGQVEF